MRAFLTCYDYGQGGIWLYIDAPSASEITTSYPTLRVFETPPPFWTENWSRLREPTVQQRAPIGPIGCRDLNGNARFRGDLN